MTQLTENVFAVEVPEDVEGCEIRGEHPGRPYQLLSFYGEAEAIDLPPGTWQILCTTKEASEEQAKGIVGSSEWYFPERHIRYIDYNHLVGPDGKQAWNIGFSNALLSLRSLLASKGLDVNKNYVLLKKGE